MASGMLGDVIRFIAVPGCKAHLSFLHLPSSVTLAPLACVLDQKILQVCLLPSVRHAELGAMLVLVQQR